jgi:uncharacterized protein YbaR (Trm112 family)
MNRTMMNILACPIDKNHPLELYETKEKNDVVLEGALFCPKCSRFYPIIEEIPIMLPDELRDKKLEIDFLKNNKENLPEKIITKANPWHL